jgi:molybdopterin biosynthesis enzyme
MGNNYKYPVQLAPLASAMERKKTDRLKFFPVKITPSGQAEEITFNGSAHITGIADADGFGLFPKDCNSLARGDLIEVIRIKNY